MRAGSRAVLTAPHENLAPGTWVLLLATPRQGDRVIEVDVLGYDDETVEQMLVPVDIIRHLDG